MKNFIIMHAAEAMVHEDIKTLGKSIQAAGGDDMQVSDGFHTMDELYDHRIALWIAVCSIVSQVNALFNTPKDVWRSKNHSDGLPAFGGEWFVLGMGKAAGLQITYHLPIKRWGETEFAETLEKAPEFDGHTSSDVLDRLAKL